MGALLEHGKIGHPVATVPLRDLGKAPETPRSLTLQTLLVVYQDQLYIAKGPTRKESIESVFPEVGLLYSLAKHRSIIGPPVALVVVSEEDDRVMGYLLKYYPHGNLRDFVIQNPSQVHLAVVCKWSAQIVEAVSHLLYTCDFPYSDIKPDNILVDEHGDLVLADFSDEGCTSWTTAPEVFHGYSIDISPDGKSFSYTSPQPANETSRPRLDGIPRDWPREAQNKAMVYSVGRSLWIIWEAIPAEKFLMAGFRPAGDFDPNRTVFTEATSHLPQAWKDFVLRCVEHDPKERPALEEIQSFFGNRRVTAV